MERAAGLLNAFYSGVGLTPVERQQVHAELVTLLRNPDTADSAARYIDAAATTVRAGGSVQLDPVVLHYALHALEERARSATFSELPASAVSGSVDLLVGFVVSAYSCNSRATQPSTPIAQHVVAKSARAAVAFGRREWAAGGNSDAQFPRTVLGLVNQNGHSAESVPRMFAGITLLTILVDDALDDPRANMLAGESRALRQNLKLCSSDILAALEVGLRIAGPSLPESVPVAAARSIASIARVHPAVAAEAATMLRRCVSGRCDRVTAEMLAVLADLFDQPSAPISQDVCREALAHAAGLLEAVAMGESAKGEDEAVCMYRIRLVAYAEAVARRVIGLAASIDALQRLFNGLMGTTLRWAKDNPHQFPAALDAWIAIFETLDDCEVEMSDQLLQTVLTALSQLCVERCMFATNAKVLRALDDDDDCQNDTVENGTTGQGTGFHAETVQTILAWDDAVELVDRLGNDATSVTTAMMALAAHGGDPEGAAISGYADGDGLGAISRAEYIDKCVETLIVLAQASIDRVGQAAVEFAGTIISQTALSPAYNNENGDIIVATDEYICDLITATNIAYSVSQLLPQHSPAARALLLAIVTQMQSALQQPTSAKPAAMFALLRTAASLARELRMNQEEELNAQTKALAEALSAAAVNVLLQKSQSHVATAATLVLLTLDKTCGTVLYPAEPPFGAAFAQHNRHNRPVCALGATGVVHWTLGHREAANSGSGRAHRWSEEEKKERTDRFSQACFMIFKEFVEACRELNAGVTAERLVEIARGAALLRTVVTGVMEEADQVKDTVWTGIGRNISTYCLEALVELKRYCSSSDRGSLESRSEGERKCLFAAMSCLVGAVGCILRGCRLQARRERPLLGTQTIQLSLEIVQGLGSARLARVLLQLLSDLLVSGGGLDQPAMIKASVQLAGRALADSDDTDLGRTAVRVLTEVMTQFWLQFWPSDVAHSSLGRARAESGDGGAPADRETYFAALRGVLVAVRSAELGTCRAGLLSLEALNASRKLYTRNESFRGCGAAEQALVAALEVLGATGDASRRSIGDEADAVIWGIANADFESFYKQALPAVVLEMGKCSPDDVLALCTGFGTATDRPSFLIALHELANDLAFLHARRSNPVL